ncbi:MAG: efflux RND transporter periplasmic adaptor subunit [Candidatus Omnitrophica bacterium]|nr:efflux RND transporter periplasmic adaptor subunit [Candidatus Omnitrophota bacterium]
MVKRMIIMLIAVGVLFGGIYGYHAFGKYMMMKYMFGAEPPAVSVSAAKVEALLWQPQLKAVGNLRAVEGVDVSSEVPGQVERISFKSGEAAAEGQVLVKLNTDSDIAQLHALEAAAVLSRTVYDRDKKQLEAQAVSRAVVDADAADLKARRAQLAQQAAMVSKKIIRAPFAGKLGISTVNPGQYLNPGDKIVTLQKLDFVYVDFFLPQQELSRVSVNQKVDLKTDAYPDRVFAGTITAINSKVEEATRNVQVEALIPNPKGELLPGMFAFVEVAAGEVKSFLTVPQTAVSFNPYGETVYIIEEEKKAGEEKTVFTAKQAFVSVGETRGDQVAVVKGLKEGDRVVTSGQLKLRNGSKIVINNQIQPLNDPSPKPKDQ